MPRKRKTFTDKFKAKVALEASGKTLAQLVSEFKVHPNQISKWKKMLISGAPELFARGSGSASQSKEELTAPLFEEIGRLKMSLRWLEKSFESVSRGATKLDRAGSCLLDPSAVSFEGRCDGEDGRD